MEILAKRFGVKVFCIDNLMVIEDDEKDEYKIQTSIVKKLKNFAKKYKCIVHLVAHPRKSQNADVNKDDVVVAGEDILSVITFHCRENKVLICPYFMQEKVFDFLLRFWVFVWLVRRGSRKVQMLVINEMEPDPICQCFAECALSTAVESAYHNACSHVISFFSVSFD